MIRLNEPWQDATAWDRFVDEHREGRFCHLFNYSDAVRCYGYQPIRMAFTKGNCLVGILPGVLANSVYFGRKIVSQPFSEYGGLLLDPSLTSEEASEIYDLLHKYLKANPKISSLEMHGDHGISKNLRQDRFVRRNPHQIAVLNLDRDPERIWKEVIQYSVRKGVTKARTNGVTASEECCDTVIRERFYPLYLSSMKRLGVPPHSLAYYLSCSKFLGQRMKIFWALRDGKYLAGLLGFVTTNRVNILNIVSEPEAWKFAPNDLVHWEFIQWATEAGFKFFDFGSVRYEGQRVYKKKWGTIFEDHSYFLLSGGDSPLVTLDSSSMHMSRLAKFWSAYIPNPVARFVGPQIRKQLVR